MVRSSNVPNAREISQPDAQEFIHIVNQMKVFLKGKIEEGNNDGFLGMFMENLMSDHWKAFIDEFEPFEIEVERSNIENTILHY